MKVRHPGPVVAIAILLSLPMAPGIIDGAIPPTDALLRFLVALLLVWGGAALVGNVMSRYSEQARRTEMVRLVERGQQAARQQAQAASGPSRVEPGPNGGPAPGPQAGPAGGAPIGGAPGLGMPPAP